jgi:hypothetical protein
MVLMYQSCKTLNKTKLVELNIWFSSCSCKPCIEVEALVVPRFLVVDGDHGLKNRLKTD